MVCGGGARVLGGGGATVGGDIGACVGVGRGGDTTGGLGGGCHRSNCGRRYWRMRRRGQRR